MDSRRSVLKKLAVGTATVAVAPTSAQAGLLAVDEAARALGIQLPSGPAPWWLIDPIAKGTPLAFGWYVASLSPVTKGAAVLSLAHSSGRQAQVHLCARGHAKPGLVQTRLLDLVLMDGGSGSFRTDEKLGRVVLGLAERIRANELDPNGDLRPLARMMPHEERVETFGPENL